MVISVGILTRYMGMTAISLKTELDVAKLLLTKGWKPEEINAILVFPLPRAAFHSLLPENHLPSQEDVTKATAITPHALSVARQVLLAAGWLDQELTSLLKPCLHSINPWRNQIHPSQPQPPENLWPWLETTTPSVSLQQYRRTMAIKRMGSLGVIILGVCLVTMLSGD